MNPRRVRNIVAALVVGLVGALSLGAAEAQNRANVVVTKTDSADPVNVGSTFTYTVTVRNEGPDPATNLMMTDTLPAGVAFVSGTSTRGNCAQNMGTITCTVASLPVSATLVLTANVVALQTGTLSNTARAQADELDAFPLNNSDTETTMIVSGGNTSTDIHVSKSASPSPATDGQPITYTITVMNLGPSAASNIRVSDRLPTAVTFDSASAGCNLSNGVVTCFIASLASGATATRTITVTPNGPGMITNNVTAAAPLNDPNPGNNLASVTTMVNSNTGFSADLGVTKTGPAMVGLGANITYTLTVTNRGPDDTVGVVVTDNLPQNVSFVSATGSGVTCNAQGRVVTCDVGDLAQNATTTITVVVRAPVTPQSITNTALVMGDDPDPVDANNSSSVVTGVGTILPPDGGVVPDGSVVTPDGSVVVPDGSVIKIDGSVVEVDGGGGEVDASKFVPNYDVHGAGCACEVGARSSGFGAGCALALSLLLGLLIARRR